MISTHKKTPYIKRLGKDIINNWLLYGICLLRKNRRSNFCFFYIFCNIIGRYGGNGILSLQHL